MIEYARPRLDFKGRAMLAVIGTAIATSLFAIGQVNGMRLRAQLLRPAVASVPPGHL